MFGTQVLAQRKPYEELDYFLKLYPEEPVVVTDKSVLVEYQLVDDSIVLKETRRTVTIHLEENTVRYASESVYSNSLTEVSDLKAYTLVPGKKKYTKLPVSDFKTSQDAGGSIFYDDTKKISFNFPSVAKGAKTVVEYTRTFIEPRFLGPFYIREYTPVYSASYNISAPENMYFDPHIFNKGDVEIKKDVSQKDGRQLITLTTDRIDKLPFEISTPSYQNLALGIHAPLLSYADAIGNKHQVLEKVEDLHGWYRTFVGGLLDKDTTVKALVDSITSPLDTDLQKIEKIYYWVQSNIKYIAFEDGMRGFIPHTGQYAIEKRYGDCKDMSSCIVSMLREADIDAHYTWVGSRDLPFKYSVTPSPIVDNHMIATAYVGDKLYFLDATGQYTPLGLPTSMIQGKEVLVSRDNENFKVETVPIISKEKSQYRDTVEIELSNGTIIGKGKASLTGYIKVFNTYKLYNANQKKTDKYVQSLLNIGSNKFEVTDYQLTGLEELNAPITLDYEFKIPDYYKAIGENIYINPILDKTMSSATYEDRKLPVENDYKYILSHTVKMSIPEGYKLEKLPKNVAKSTNNVGFEISYALDENTLWVTKKIFENYLIMPIDEIDAYNEVINAYAKASRKAIILTKSK